MSSTSDAAPTTTYPFYETTYINPSPSTITPYPTTYTDTTWLPHISADPLCTSARSYPSIEGPLGLQPACVISNAANINPNAFWDVYECCPGHDMSAYGYSVTGGDGGQPGICMMQCYVDESLGMTWQEVGECLQKRVKEVICMPEYEERNDTVRTGSVEGTGTAQVGGSISATLPTASSAASGIGQSASVAGSTGAAPSLDVVHASSSKTGMFALLLLAVGSAAGMFL